MTSTTAPAGTRRHISGDCRMAPKTIANVQQPTQLRTKIASVSRNPATKNPALSGMTLHFQSDSIPIKGNPRRVPPVPPLASRCRSDLESEQSLDERDRPDRGERQQEEGERAGR